MSCEECEKAQQDDAVAYYRWKYANIQMDGCDEHLREVMDVLTEHQRGAAPMVTVEEIRATAMGYTSRLSRKEFDALCKRIHALGIQRPRLEREWLIKVIRDARHGGAEPCTECDFIADAILKALAQLDTPVSPSQANDTNGAESIKEPDAVTQDCPAKYHHVESHDGTFSCLDADTNPLPDCTPKVEL